MQLIWSPDKSLAELHPVFHELGRHYAILARQDGVAFTRSCDNRLAVSCSDDSRAVVTYAPYGRANGRFLDAGMVKEKIAQCRYVRDVELPGLVRRILDMTSCNGMEWSDVS